MKLKTAVKDYYGSHPEPELRTGLAAFLRRLGTRGAPVSHYACRGPLAGALAGFLKALGFEDGRDFEVAASAFDPAACSVQWLETGRAEALALELHGVEGSRWMDRMAANPRMTPDHASGGFADTGHGVAVSDPAPAGAQSSDAGHFVNRVADTTGGILGAVRLLSPERETIAKVPNGAEAVRLAKAWAERALASGGALPLVAPFPVLEAYYRFVLLDNPFEDDVPPDYIKNWSLQGKEAPLLTMSSPEADAIFRVLREGEAAHFGCFGQAPIHVVADESPECPMTGYAYRKADTARGVGLAGKTSVIGAFDAPLFYGAGPAAGGMDFLTPVRTAATRRREFWSYVEEVLSACYGGVANTGVFSVGLGLALSNHSEAWDGTVWQEVYPPGDGGAPGERLTAKFYAILSDGELGGMEPCASTLSDEDAGVAPPVGEVDLRSFGDEGFEPAESALEWFLMTHGVPCPTVHTHLYGSHRQTSKVYADARENLKAVRACAKSEPPELWAVLTSAAANRGLGVQGDQDYVGGSDYNVVARGAEGCFASMSVPLALRLAYGSRDLPMKAWRGAGAPRHEAGVVVSNVYSGITGEGAAFTLPPEDPAEVTKWLASMAGDGAAAQVQTPETPHRAVVVVETNVDAARYEAGAGMDELRGRLLTAFAQNILVRNRCALVPTDEFAASRRTTTAREHGRSGMNDYIMAGIGEFASATFQSDASVRPALYHGARVPNTRGAHMEGVALTTRKDAHGRLVLVFSVDAAADSLSYARAAFRYLEDLPLVDASVRRAAYEDAAPRGLRTDADPADPKTGVMYMHAYLLVNDDPDSAGVCQLGSWDFPTAGAVGPEYRDAVLGYLAIGYPPPRAWYLQRCSLSNPAEEDCSDEDED